MSVKVEDDLLEFTTVDAQSTIPLKQSLSSSLSKSLTINDENNKIHKQRRKSGLKGLSKDVDADDDDDDNDKSRKKDNINEKIQELLTLIPEPYFSDNKDRSSGTKDGKPNKGQILTKCVEYLQDFQNKIDENNRKEVELIWKLKKLSQVKNQPITTINLNNTSAEIVLADIGVGPLANQQQPIDSSRSQSSSNNKPNTPNNNFEYGGYDQYS
ncbi:hypothetical protein WICMUC_003383 [Wickerhamomyces mucosus]|uniref:BHLH domain-containing protein n=1 Tax=Wickerhamomyces mucosus TaxID=1378264 RepID=A0A9P8PLR7_9ASCO|nr:hypothetical protein WICMUC_003383 [Wickerhamomyces mucosus]